MIPTQHRAASSISLVCRQSNGSFLRGAFIESQNILGWKESTRIINSSSLNGPYGDQTINLGIINTMLQPTELNSESENSHGQADRQIFLKRVGYVKSPRSELPFTAVRLVGVRGWCFGLLHSVVDFAVLSVKLKLARTLSDGAGSKKLHKVVPFTGQ